jgi:hypothetical protein
MLGSCARGRPGHFWEKGTQDYFLKCNAPSDVIGSRDFKVKLRRKEQFLKHTKKI